jgi:cytoskeleton protein RodZ
VVEAVESSWVSARIDGGDTKEVFLQPGQKVIWRASDYFLVSFGNAGGVKIQFNGKDLPPFGPKGAVVKDVKIGRE